MKSAARVLVKAALTTGRQVRVYDFLEGWFAPPQDLESIMREVRATEDARIRMDVPGTPTVPETAYIVNGLSPDEEVYDWSVPAGGGFIDSVMERFLATT